MPPPERIILVGFMGSGKSTVGRHLAAALGWHFIDLDQAIEQHERRTVADIFAQDGEPRFRALELSTLTALLTRTHCVVALGGGAPTQPAVCTLLQAAAGTILVHLEAPFDLLYQRCQLQQQDPSAAIRPLLGDRASAEARFQQRHPLYTGLARHTADASLPDPQAVAEAIAAALFPPFPKQ